MQPNGKPTAMSVGFPATRNIRKIYIQQQRKYNRKATDVSIKFQLTQPTELVG